MSESELKDITEEFVEVVKSWVKLDKGSKLNHLTLFIEKECEDKNLNEEGKKKLKKLLFHVCENGSLNKVNDVEYSDDYDL